MFAVLPVRIKIAQQTHRLKYVDEQLQPALRAQEGCSPAAGVRVLGRCLGEPFPPHAPPPAPSHTFPGVTVVTLNACRDHPLKGNSCKD